MRQKARQIGMTIKNNARLKTGAFTAEAQSTQRPAEKMTLCISLSRFLCVLCPLR